MPKLTVETVTIPYVNRTHRVIARPVIREPGMVANHELGGDASGYVGISLDDGVSRDELFTTQTREATDNLIDALVRARNSAYPDSGSLATFQAATASPAVAIREVDYFVPPIEPPLAEAESPYAAWRGRHGIDGSVVVDYDPMGASPSSGDIKPKPVGAYGHFSAWYGVPWDHHVPVNEDPQPASPPQSEQPRREAALRRVIERELGRMDQEGV